MNYNELTKEELIHLLEENENTTGKYGLVWDKEKEPEKIVIDCDKNIPVLQEINEKNILSSNYNNNLLIEGDNFHSLSILNYTHKNKIDVIYIDPPYNTGSNDFTYNDRIVDPEDGYRHSKWLNFMEKRLKLARNVLKEDGFIFISIGDDEFAQLKLLCDKIFNPSNFVTNFTWIQTTNPPSLGKIRNNMEYVVCYQNRPNNIKLFGRNSNEKDSPLANGGNNNTRITIPKGTCEFPNDEEIVINPEMKKSGVNLLDKVVVKNHRNENDFSVEFQSKWRQENVINETNNGTKFLIKDSSYFSIRYQKSAIGYVVPDKFLDPTKFDVKDNEFGRKQLEELVGKGKFSYPKNTPLIKTLIKMVAKDNKNAIILDFFAGSGTTGQAVLELNKEDGGHRQFILCTNNENNICEDVTYLRIERAIKGYEKFNPLDGGLKYYKCEFVENSNNRDQLYFDLTEKCIPMMCIKDNNFIEYKSTDEYKIFTNEDKTSYSCVYYYLFGDKEDEFIKELENINEFKSIYKFSLGDTVDTSMFKNVKNYNVEAIPYKIVELYKRIVKMSRED